MKIITWELVVFFLQISCAKINIVALKLFRKCEISPHIYKEAP